MAATARYINKMQTNLTDETCEEVKKIADDQGISYSEVLRKAIEAGLPHVPGYQPQSTSNSQ